MAPPDGRTVIFSVKPALVPPAFVAVSVTVVTPTTAGVPDRIPVTALIDNQDGRPAALKLVGLFVAVIV
jgi:hypothetical protein